jgi:hypothetical protein
MLFLAWMSETHRPTRDLDLLGRGESSPESSKAIFRELCAISANDGRLSMRTAYSPSAYAKTNCTKAFV